MRRRVPGRVDDQSQVVTDSAARQAASPSRLFPLTRLAGWMAEMHADRPLRRSSASCDRQIMRSTLARNVRLSCNDASPQCSDCTHCTGDLPGRRSTPRFPL
jgi:hypothetical protein